MFVMNYINSLPKIVVLTQNKIQSLSAGPFSLSPTSSHSSLLLHHCTPASGIFFPALPGAGGILHSYCCCLESLARPPLSSSP